MELLIVIGNLGSNAEYRNENGNEYIKFNVAESRRWQSQDGKEHEETIWNSCIMHGKNEKLMPFLTKGSKVCVVGRASTRVYSSEKERRMVAGISINVDRLELVGATADPVPRNIVGPDGIIHPVGKCFFMDVNEARKYVKGKSETVTMFDQKGSPSFVVDYNGFVTRVNIPTDSQSNTGESKSQGSQVSQS